MSNVINPSTACDFYKTDHRRQYPEGTSLVYSNFTPRSVKHNVIPAPLFTGKVTFFGLQYLKVFCALPKKMELLCLGISRTVGTNPVTF